MYIRLKILQLCNSSCYCVDQEQEKIDQLPGDKKDLFNQLQRCEEDLKTANECEI